jgi:pimeloyl-ACP methyl ester carboxylesterase
LAQADDTPTIVATAQAAATSDGWRGWLRRCVESEEDRRRYGLRLDEGWSRATVEGPVVVLVHGFNSTPERSENLIASARQAGMSCGVFAYPNDQPLRASAELLSSQLKAFAAKHPGRRVALVTHSMGGLVARECLEDEALNPPNVDRLIMVAPPTHGSMLAQYAMGLDLWEHWLNRRDGDPWQRTRDSIIDGLSEAPTDLRPGSAFLTRLNARPRAPGVRYTLLLGSSSCVSAAQHYMIRKTLCVASDCCPSEKVDPEAIDRILSKMDEVIDGRGDGAVAVSRGRLEGVTDTHVLPFDHLSVVRDEQSATSRRVQQMIVIRLLSAGGA